MNLDEKLAAAGPFKKGSPDRVADLEKQVQSLTDQLELILGLIQTNTTKTNDLEVNLGKLVDYVTA